MPRKIILPGQSLYELYPDVMKQWDWDKNKDLNPKMLLPGSNTEAWFKCDKGHSYKTKIQHKAIR